MLDKFGLTVRQGFALPKPDLSKFDGNPLKCWSFFRSFENTVEQNAISESEKFMYLMQYTMGNAEKTIECCMEMDPSKGYVAARKLLQECFGHPKRIAAKFGGEITEGPQIRQSKSSGLIELADQLRNCEHTLKSMGYLAKSTTWITSKELCKGCHFIFIASSLKWQTLFNNLVRDQT